VEFVGSGGAARWLLTAQASCFNAEFLLVECERNGPAAPAGPVRKRVRSQDWRPHGMRVGSWGCDGLGARLTEPAAARIGRPTSSVEMRWVGATINCDEY